MQERIKRIFSDIREPIFYLTNDVSHGLGLEKVLPNYHIICIDDHPLVDYLINDGVKVFCLERVLQKKNIIFRTSGKLLEQPEVRKYIKQNSAGKIPNILYFKPSVKLEGLCRRFGYRNLGNPVSLNRLFEDKISFFKICQELGIPVPKGEIVFLAEADFARLRQKYGPKMVIQFGRGWAGSTSFLIENEEEFNILKRKFFQTKVKLNRFIKGKTVLNNACVTGEKILLGPPAEQLTGVCGFTARPLGTCGRVWPAKLSQKQEIEIEKLTRKIGKEMQKKGYLGYFGLDFLIEEESGRVFLSENNARFTASAPFFTKLEIKEGRLPLMLYHVKAFLRQDAEIQRYRDAKILGSEVIVRNTAKVPIAVEEDFRPGVYRREKGELKFVRIAYDIGGIKNQEEFFLTASAKGRIVNPEIELIRFNSLTSVIEDNGEITPWVKSILGIWLF